MATYKDIDFNFLPHPVSGDLVVKKDSQAVKQALKNIILTNFYERGFNTNLGSNVRASLFENITELAAIELRTNIETAINNFEPRADIVEVHVSYDDNNTLYADIQYNILNTQADEVLRIELERVR